MSTVLWIILIILSLIILLAIWSIITKRKFELRKVKWLEEEGNCQIDDVPGARFENYTYRDNGREIDISVSWVDMKNGTRIYMDGFEENSATISIEDNKIIAARTLKYFGFVVGKDTLKLNYEGFDHPSDDLVRQIEDKIQPIGFVRVSQVNDNEITWIKK